MLTLLLALLGALIGAGIDGDWLGPGLAGMALGLVLNLRLRIKILERELAWLRAGRSVPSSVAEGVAGSVSAPARPSPVRPGSPSGPAPAAFGLATARSQAEAARAVPEIETDILADWDEPPEAEALPRPASAPPPNRPSTLKIPSALHLWLTRARDWLLGGNLMVRAGVVVLFFGVAFLLKLAADNAWLPIELRLAAVGAGGIALLGLGWRLRGTRTLYALALQGGGVGILYLTVFAALRLYGLIQPGPAFAVLAVLAACSAALAVLQNAPSLAVLGAAGGFLAPVLTSTGQGSHVALFSYYLVLDLGVLGIAWFRSWRALNLTGFVFTFVIASLWGYRFYRPELFDATQPFLIAFALVYVAVALLYALRQPDERLGLVDPTLVLGVPLVGFALQARLVSGMEYGLAWSALIAAAFYIALAGLGFARWGAQLRLLAESFLAIGTVFATLAVPLALDARWTAGLWALEGAAMVWIGGRQGRLAPRAFGYLLQIGAALALIRAAWEAQPDLPILNGIFLGAVLVAVAGLFIAWHLQGRRADGLLGEAHLYLPFLAWGLLWWYGAWVVEILDQTPMDSRLIGILAVCFAASALLADRLRTRLHWEDLRLPALALLPLLYLLLPLAAWLLERPLEGWALAGWSAGLAGHLYLLRREDDRGASEGMAVALLHQAGLWLALILLSWELAWWLDRLVQGADTWSHIAWALVPAGAMLTLTHLGERLPWPICAHPRLYLDHALAPVAVFLWTWVLLHCLGSRGRSDPLTYLPLLNPLDLVVGFALLVLADWLYPAGESGEDGARGPRVWRYPFAPGALGLTVFVWLNSAWLRTAHHWLGLPFSPDGLLQSQTVQAGLSVLWALAGLGCMLLGSRLRQRQSWLAGAGLMGAVVLKLFLVDLSGSGTLARIVSFLSVGVLLLVVGYASPLPPRAQDRRKP